MSDLVFNSGPGRLRWEREDAYPESWFDESLSSTSASDDAEDVLEYDEETGRGEMAWERSNDSPPGYTLALTIYTFSSTRGEEKEKKRRRKDTYMILQVSTNINHTPFQHK
jgi:hypothetical protein